jgi:hypothetical protein
MKLLDEIVDLLTDENASLTVALLKTKVLLHKIDQKELVGWVNDEINGYDDVASIPAYRRLKARVLGNIASRAGRHTNYTLPLMHLEAHVRNFLQEAPMGHSLGVLETIVGDGKQNLKTPTPPELLAALSEPLSSGFIVENAWSQIEQSQVRQVLMEVRSRLLDFVLALQGEIGETVSDDDVKKATAGLDVPGMFAGAVIGPHAVIQVGGSYNTQRVSNNTIIGDKNALAAELRGHDVADDDIAALNTALSTDPAAIASGGQLGPAVKGWMKRMMEKAIDASWNIELGVAGGLLTSALQRYYGI